MSSILLFLSEGTKTVSTVSSTLPLLSEGTQNGRDTASVGIRDSPMAARSAEFLSSDVILFTDEALDTDAVFELIDTSTAGSDCKDTSSLSIEAIADGLDKITEVCSPPAAPDISV